jgi:hypothetical protein
MLAHNTLRIQDAALEREVQGFLIDRQARGLAAGTALMGQGKGVGAHGAPGCKALR